MKSRTLFSLVPLLLVCSCIPTKPETPTAKPQSKDIPVAGENKSNIVNIPEWFSDRTILEKLYPGKQFGYGLGISRNARFALRKAKSFAMSDLSIQLGTNEIVGYKLMNSEMFVESQICTLYVAIALDK